MDNFLITLIFIANTSVLCGVQITQYQEPRA